MKKYRKIGVVKKDFIVSSKNQLIHCIKNIFLTHSATIKSAFLQVYLRKNGTKVQ
jgi:hypothetical protein